MLERVGLGDRLHFLPARPLGRAEAAGGDRAGARRLAAGDPGRRADGEPRHARSGAQILELFRDLAKAEGRGSLVVTHDPKVRRIADRVVGIATGGSGRDAAAQTAARGTGEGSGRRDDEADDGDPGRWSGTALAAATVLQARGPARPRAGAAPPAPPAAARAAAGVAAEGRVVAYPGAEVKVGAERAGRLVRVARRGGPDGAARASSSPRSSRTSCAPPSPRRGPAWPRPRRRAGSPRRTSQRRQKLARGAHRRRERPRPANRDVETSRARGETARATVDALRGAARARAASLAPIAGTVIARQVDAGQMVEAGDHAFTVADLGRLRIEGEAHEADAGGDRARRAGRDHGRRLPGPVLEGPRRGDPRLGHPAAAQAAGPEPADRHARPRGEGGVRRAHAAQARHDRGAADRAGGPLTWRRHEARARHAGERGPGRFARHALPFLWRRMRASFAPRPGAAPFVPFDAGGAALRTPALTWIGHATFYVRHGRRGLPHRPRLLRAREPAAPSPARRRLVPPGVPLDALPPARLRAALARPLRPHRPADDPAARRRAACPSSCRRGMGELVRGAGGRVAAELALVGERRGRGRDGDLRARAALLRPRPHRPQPPPLGRLRRSRARRAASTTRATPRSSTASPRSAGASGRSTSPACRSAPTCRARSWRPVHLNPEEAVAGGARPRRARSGRHALRHVRPRRRAARRAAAPLPGRGAAPRPRRPRLRDGDRRDARVLSGRTASAAADAAASARLTQSRAPIGRTRRVR